MNIAERWVGNIAKRSPPEPNPEAAGHHGNPPGMVGGVMFQMFHMGCVESQEMCSDVFFLGYLKSIQK
jgi:hypothetical protein